MKSQVRELLARALDLHRAGDRDQAASLYRQILEIDAGCADALHLLGMISHQHGEHARAIELITRAVTLVPDNAVFHSSLGNALRAAGRHAEALVRLRRSVELKPASGEGWNNLGHALLEADHVEEAEKAFHRAVELAPDLVEARFNYATALHRQEKLLQAIAEYRQVIAARPGFEPARNNLAAALVDEAHRWLRKRAWAQAVERLEEAGSLRPDAAEVDIPLAEALAGQRRFAEGLAVLDRLDAREPERADSLLSRALILRDSGDRTAAATVVRRLVEIAPDAAIAHDLLGELLAADSQVDDALAAHRRAVELDPKDVDARCRLGGLLQTLGRLPEARAVYEEALEIEPDAWRVHNCLGTLYLEQAEPRLALAEFRKALVPEPRIAPLCNLGVLLRRMGRLEEGAKPLRLALKLDPANLFARNNLAIILADQGRLEEADAILHEALERDPGYTVARSNLIYFWNFRADVSPEEIFEGHLEWDRRHGRQFWREGLVHANAPDPDRKLRIGYVSPDFRQHSVAYFFEPVLRSHDRERFEVHCYAELHHPDRVTERLQGLGDGWYQITGLHDEAVSRRIAEDGIDILVDLAGHTGDNRLTLFAHRPAPVQVTWLGYPNTTGMRAMDYRFADEIVEPPGDADVLSTETIVRLPHGFHCYQPPPDTPDVEPLPALHSGRGVCFGSFNDLKKTQPAVLECWARILERVPGSWMLLKCSSFLDETSRTRLLEMASAAGIDTSRLTLVPKVNTMRDHLGLYGKIDIGLDPFPYNGTTTTCEALWMGVPVLTMRGDRHAARVGASLLTRVGLKDWIAESPDEYVELAVWWAGRLEELAEVRKGLRDRVAASPLCDPAVITRTVEEAYREMWRTWCARQPRH